MCGSLNRFKHRAYPGGFTAEELVFNTPCNFYTGWIHEVVLHINLNIFVASAQGGFKIFYIT